jgi:2'-5' RNA ligase
VGGGEPLVELRRAYRHGALVVLLDGPEFALVALARATFDPGSAALIGPHVTLTPPFAEAPTLTALERLQEIASDHLPVTLTIGGAGRFAGSDVVYLRVEPARPLVGLHVELLATGLFAASRWAGGAFVPHATISEFGVDPDGAEHAASSIPAVKTVARALTWVTPGDDVAFVTPASLA